MKTKEQKRKEGAGRHHAAQLRTPEEQLRRLDDKLGKDVGATKERQRLLDLIKANRKEKTKKKKDQEELSDQKKDKVEESVVPSDEAEGSSRPRKIRRSMKKKRKSK